LITFIGIHVYNDAYNITKVKLEMEYLLLHRWAQFNHTSIASRLSIHYFWNRQQSQNTNVNILTFSKSCVKGLGIWKLPSSKILWEPKIYWFI